MHIHTVALHNFRNFTQVEEVAFPKDALLVAAAPNATGKTNFLEALVVLLRGKSFRGSLDDCVRWGEHSFLVRGHITRHDTALQLATRYHLPTRTVRIEEDGVPSSPITFFSRYPLVVFLPEDTFLFSRGPALRRSFLNHTLVSSPAYVTALVQYQRALKQRNAALKRAKAPADIAAWTDLLVEHSTLIWNTRETFLQFLSTHLEELYTAVSGETRSFKIQLLPAPADGATYRQQLQEAFLLERRYGYTAHGPHRDDMVVTSEGKPLASVLSRGQLRSVVIALKLAVTRYLTHTTDEVPLLLFDDVLSELDVDHQTRLLKHLPTAQILLTCTTFPTTLRQDARVHMLDLRSILDPLPVALPQAARAEAAAVRYGTS